MLRLVRLNRTFKSNSSELVRRGIIENTENPTLFQEYNYVSFHFKHYHLKFFCIYHMIRQHSN
jgi:hypothetical protein